MARIEAPLSSEKEPYPATAWLFPGQGMQGVGMGLELYNNHPLSRLIFHSADQLLNQPLSQLMFKGPEEQLRQTLHTQTAVFVFNHAWLQTLQEERAEGFNQQPQVVAGHSLGEYNALVAAGCLTFQDGLRLVNARAESMQFACEVNPGGMLVVPKPTEKAMFHLTNKLSLEVAAINTNEQVVLGGTLSNIEKGTKWLKERGLRPFSLKVAGAFHTSLMQPAVENFGKVLEKVTIQNPQIQIIANVNAQPLHDAHQIRRELLQQLTRPVLWREIIAYLDRVGIERTFEVGEEGILTNMNRKVIGGVTAGIVLTATGLTAAILWRRHHQRQP